VGLIGTGLIILFDNALGLSASGKVTLKSVHASFGYVMALNLLWRFAWAFFGGRYARWRAIVPAGTGYLAALRAYTASFLSGEPQQYGHNPLARIGVSLLFLLLLVQAVTGLVIAGTILAALRALVRDLGSRSWDRPCEHCSRRQGADRPSLLRFNACVPPAIR
ncbi:MAG: cytochrome b/b6 domain-containing protein, partial [Hyphomicrobium sp.]